MDQPPAACGSSRVTVWYDGACPLCAREIALMRRLDRRGRVTFVDIAREAQCPKDRTAMLLRLHARENGGDIVTGAAAFAAMWRAMPLLQPLGVLARSGAVLWLLEHCYCGFLRVRPTLQSAIQRLEAGLLPARTHHGA